MMQFFFQSSNFRGPALQYRDLIRNVFLEKISHIELALAMEIRYHRPVILRL